MTDVFSFMFSVLVKEKKLSLNNTISLNWDYFLKIFMKIKLSYGVYFLLLKCNGLKYKNVFIKYSNYKL